MVAYTSRETQALRDAPANIPGDAAYNARERRIRATIELNNLRVNSLNGTAVAGIAIGDDFLLGDIPPGYRFAAVEVVSSIGLGATAINVGITQVHATNIKFVNGMLVPTANLLAQGANGAARALPPSVGERVFVTFGAESEPASANTITVDLILIGP